MTSAGQQPSGAARAPSSVDWRSLPRLVQAIGADGLLVTSAANLVVGLIIGFLGVSQLGRFGFVAVATALLMAAAMQIVAVKLAVPYLIATLVSSVLVFLAWTYPAQRRLVFRRRLAAL